MLGYQSENYYGENMGTIYSFERGKRPSTLTKLRGRRPLGHPEVKYGPRGRVLLAPQQVWVEGHTGVLWIIESLRHMREGFYPFNVTLVRYDGTSKGARILSEHTMRSYMEVWEDAVQSRKRIAEKLKDGSPHPFGSNKAAAQFFGIDPDTGNRVDD